MILAEDLETGDKVMHMCREFTVKYAGPYKWAIQVALFNVNGDFVSVKVSPDYQFEGVRE